MDSEKILSRLVQIGTVSDVDNGKRRARRHPQRDGAYLWLALRAGYAALHP